MLKRALFLFFIPLLSYGGGLDLMGMVDRFNQVFVSDLIYIISGFLILFLIFRTITHLFKINKNPDENSVSDFSKFLIWGVLAIFVAFSFLAISKFILDSVFGSNNNDIWSPTFDWSSNDSWGDDIDNEKTGIYHNYNYDSNTVNTYDDFDSQVDNTGLFEAHE